jgi:DNA-binding NarL/FixJ family response regulator
MRILIVEDHPALGRTMMSTVKRLRPDADVDLVASLADARRSVAEHAPECILTDLGLPDATDLQALQELRALAPKARIAVNSSRDDNNIVQRALDGGADAYLLKGYDPDLYYNELTAFLAKG